MDGFETWLVIIFILRLSWRRIKTLTVNIALKLKSRPKYVIQVNNSFCTFTVISFVDLLILVTFLFPNGLDIWHQFTITVLSSVQNTIHPILLLKTDIRVNKYFTKRTIYVEMLMAQHLFNTYLVHAYN